MFLLISFQIFKLVDECFQHSAIFLEVRLFGGAEVRCQRLNLGCKILQIGFYFVDLVEGIRDSLVSLRVLPYLLFNMEEAILVRVVQVANFAICKVHNVLFHIQNFRQNLFLNLLLHFFFDFLRIIYLQRAHMLQLLPQIDLIHFRSHIIFEF